MVGRPRPSRSRLRCNSETRPCSLKASLCPSTLEPAAVKCTPSFSQKPAARASGPYGISAPMLTKSSGRVSDTSPLHGRSSLELLLDQAAIAAFAARRRPRMSGTIVILSTAPPASGIANATVRTPSAWHNSCNPRTAAQISLGLADACPKSFVPAMMSTKSAAFQAPRLGRIKCARPCPHLLIMSCTSGSSANASICSALIAFNPQTVTST
mmetsp:Transcript_2618/g.4413  ORF Transcript_2618/g.4413 Transcript_2618/m.4413 type:complete len:212 (-) Transcript_2618:117-752(-)